VRGMGKKKKRHLLSLGKGGQRTGGTKAPSGTEKAAIATKQRWKKRRIRKRHRKGKKERNASARPGVGYFLTDSARGERPTGTGQKILV